MSEYEVVVGLEVHVQLLTESKLFCGCSTEFGASPNEHTCPVCLGLPGALPVLNRKAVELAIRTGLALNCKIRNVSDFYRKHYFYPDLPKAYQISQYDKPVVYDGYVDIVSSDGESRRIRIKRAHLEEDAGKLIHKVDPLGNEYTLVDCNRGGMGLLEIVTEPDIRSPEDAKAFLEKLKLILEYIEVSDCNMEEGSLRCDANISIRPVGSSKFGTKTELKNMNSFRAVERALAYEAERQIELVSNGGTVVAETRRWDEAQGKTIVMRTKEEATDYRYMPEPDLPPLVISDEWIESVRESLPELADEKAERFVREYGIPEYDASILTSSKSLAEFYEQTVALHNDPKAVSNWMMGEVLRLLNLDNATIDECKIRPKHLADLLKLIDEGVVSITGAKTVFEEVYKTGKEPSTVVDEKNLRQMGDKDELEKIVAEVISENPGPVSDYLSGKEKAAGFLVGQVMRKTKGRANPQLANELVRKQLNEMK